MSTEDRNPSPPTPDLLDVDPDIFHADTIGDTVFSKRWVFATLIKLLKEVQKEPTGKSAQELNNARRHGIDMEESLETDLCKLWDMTANQDVSKFLHEWKAQDILTNVIEYTTAPRTTEICMGILANMACCREIAGHLSTNDKIRSLSLDFLGSSDTQTLIQTTRLLSTCLSSKTEGAVDAWLQNISTEFYQRLSFILQSSTNTELLYNVGFIISTLFSLDETLVQDWTDTEQIVSFIEALRQVRSGAKSTAAQSRTISLLLSCLEIVVADDDGMMNLVSASDTVLPLLSDFLWGFCEDEVVTVEGSEGSLASTIYIIEVVMANMEGASDIADTLRKYPKLLKGAVEIFACLYSQRVSTETEIENQTQGCHYNMDAGKHSEKTDEKSPTVSRTCLEEAKGEDASKQNQEDNGEVQSCKLVSDGQFANTSASKESPVVPDAQSASLDKASAEKDTYVLSGDRDDRGNDESLQVERRELSENLSSFFVFLLREAGGSTSQSQVARLLRDACSDKHRAVLREGMARTKASPEIQELLAATLGDGT